jgi:hypothetical protein
MRKQIVAMLLVSSSVVAALATTPAGPSSTAYTQDGRLKFPDGYREWVYLTSGLDMTYLRSADAVGQLATFAMKRAPAASRQTRAPAVRRAIQTRARRLPPRRIAQT